MIGKDARRAARDREGVAPAAGLGVEPAESGERAGLDLVAAPGDRQRLEPRDRVLGRDRALGERERSEAQGGLGGDRALRRLGEAAIGFERGLALSAGL